MSEDGRRSPGTDPTLTPSQLIANAPTSASLPGGHEASTGLLPSRYQLGARLGEGGMGEVLVATDRQIDREVAIKRMRIAPSPGAVARFVREAKIQGRLDHPAIVPVHELATDADGRPFFVMKRLAGTTLAELIATPAQTTRQKLLRAFADVCLAIEFAHSRRVVHRDLKPANIMLGDYGEVYVLDWGVARLLDDADDAIEPSSSATDDGQTEAGAILGTPGYIAPELLRGERADGRADVFALGCILFEILAGESLLPRGHGGLDATLGPFDARPSQRTAATDVPPELDALCVAATASDRGQRPTARELATKVEQYLDGDRDLALRKAVAATHANVAREALARGDGEVERATAMREAGRAIAIDPENRDAAELVARLVLEPPREVPREVDERVADVERATVLEKVRMMVFVEASILLFVPLVFLMGVRSYTALGVFLVGILLNIASTVYGALNGRAPTIREVYAAAVLFAAFVAIVGHMFSPFLIAPALGVVAVMFFAMDARARWLPLALIYIAAVFAPWLLEEVGSLAETTSALGGDLLIRSVLVVNREPHSEISLAVFTIGLMVIGGFMTARLALAHRRALRSIELQAWHLRQLVS